MEDSKFHLIKISKSFKLKDHEYYLKFQVYGELAVANAVFYDFVTWTTKEFYLECIYLNILLGSRLTYELIVFYHEC